MELWLLLLLLGLFTYFIVKRSVANITRTPVWLLWMVMMTPAFIWSAWILVYGEDKRMPPALEISPFIICPILYWLLIQWGRRDFTPPPKPQEMVTEQAQNPSEVQPVSAGDAGSTVRPIDKTEETNLRNCFPWSIYYLQNIDYRPQAVICRGKLRTNPEVAYQTIRENIEGLFGDRFFVVFQEGLNGSPFFALVPNPQAHSQAQQQTEPLKRPALALGLLLVTLFTTTLVGVEISEVSNAALQSNPALLLKGLPYALALVAILGIHELGHYLSAQYYKIRTTLPYFIPVPFFLGTFGAFIGRRSPVPSRKALFDLGIASSVAGFLVTLPLLFWGLAHSDVVAVSEQSSILNFTSLNPRFSLLLTLLSKWALGSELTANMAIKLHPVGVAAYIGFIWTAFKLMPVGHLDGGHIVHAMFGQRNGAMIGQISRLLMLGLSLVQPDLFIWAIFLFLMPVSDEPALNDVSELDNKRDLWGLLVLALLVSILLPVPGNLAQLLKV
ncbi:site-2 protease family protein [Trichocoleus sp. DQ-U1]|uniref:site-2 protease family protein n=1 Tax=Trichocoleus sp. DQ-U1 TaxID=2933926 RepID=UPI003298F3F6